MRRNTTACGRAKGLWTRYRLVLEALESREYPGEVFGFSAMTVPGLNVPWFQTDSGTAQTALVAGHRAVPNPADEPRGTNAHTFVSETIVRAGPGTSASSHAAPVSQTATGPWKGHDLGESLADLGLGLDLDGMSSAPTAGRPRPLKSPADNLDAESPAANVLDGGGHGDTAPGSPGVSRGSAPLAAPVPRGGDLDVAAALLRATSAPAPKGQTVGPAPAASPVGTTSAATLLPANSQPGGAHNNSGQGDGSRGSGSDGPPPPSAASCRADGQGGPDGDDYCQKPPPNPPDSSNCPVNYFDGSVLLSSVDLSSDSLGGNWGLTRSWGNNVSYYPWNGSSFTPGLTGRGMFIDQLPYVKTFPTSPAGVPFAAVITSATTTLQFDNPDGPNPTAEFNVLDKFSHSGGEYVLDDTSGNETHFYDGRAGVRAGKFKSLMDAYGNLTTVTGWTAAGNPAEVQRTSGPGQTPVVESYLYDYVPSGVNQNLLARATLRRQVAGGDWVTVRQVAYSYYNMGEPYGNPQDLKTAIVEDAAGDKLDTTYYRYYDRRGSAANAFDGLKFVFKPDSYARLVAAIGDPSQAADDEVMPYADNYFNYDFQYTQLDGMYRVLTERAQGAGSSTDNGGLGTFTFSYSASSNARGFNSWWHKTIEILPDNSDNFVSQNTVYTNGYGQVMLKVYESGAPGHTQQWDTYYRYDNAGRIIRQANPSAVNGFDDHFADLLHNVGGHYQYLNDHDGEITVTDYYPDPLVPTATETTPGGVDGYFEDTKIQQGQLGTPILQSSRQYLARTGDTFDVNVTTGGTSANVSADRFTYVDVPPPVPVVSGFGMDSGSVLGGQAVLITGSGFTGASAVYFGGTRATSFTVSSDTAIVAQAPGHAAGMVDVTVVTPGGTSAVTAADRFTFVAPPAPVVAGFDRSTGTIFGGGTLTITGTHLSAASRVAFGTTPAPFTVRSDNAISVQVPAQAAGMVDVTVTTPGGTSATTAADRFTYVNPAAPVVTGLSQGSGTVVGGGDVTIIGSGFTGATAVSFGRARTSFTVNSDHSITARIPAQAAAGAVDVTVTTPGGTSAATPADRFGYLLPTAPVVTGLARPHGVSAGGTSITIVGTDFSGATAVTFGDAPAGPFTVNSSTLITATAPPHAVGTVDVTVTTPGGTSAMTAGDQFTYVVNEVSDPPQPVVAGLSATSGGTAGGTFLTIVGTGFRGVTAVNFGNTRPTSVTVVSPTLITAYTPAEPAGVVDVRVTNLRGTSDVTPGDEFTFVAPPLPVVTGLSQTSGAIFGGDLLTVIGTGLTGATRVAVDGTLATNVTVLSDTAVRMRLPAHAAGAVDVTVTTPGGTSAVSDADVYRYVLPAAPEVSGLSLTSGTVLGGMTLAVVGTGFTGATQVAFGATAATNVTVLSDTAISVRVPGQAAGMVDVTVTTPGGTSTAVTTDQFTYVTPPVPVVTAVTPDSGSPAGRYQVTILGSGLSGASEVDFGGTPAPSFTVRSDGEIDAQAPPEASGVIHIAVTTPGGTSALTTLDQFTYLTAVPAVTGLSPTTGTVLGGGIVTIIGNNFSGATAVSFGGTPATEVTVISDHAVSARIPAHDPGTVDVTVTTPGGTSVATAADRYTYAAPVPVVSGLSPNEGSTAGGYTLTIIGSGFTNATAVSFGDVPGTAVTVLSDSALYVRVPTQDAGTVDVTVTTPGGTSATMAADQFTYVPNQGTGGAMPVVTGVGPVSGSTLGGSLVTILGSGFLGTTAVKFGTVNATAVTVLSESALTVRTPAEVEGTVDVTVTARGNTSAITPADQFTYAFLAPVVTGLSVTSGSKAGGYSITVIGSGFTKATAVSFGGTSAASFTLISDNALNVIVPFHALITYYPVATSTVYRNTDGTGAETTQYAFTWYPGTTRVESETVAKPVVSANQNGPGTPDVETTVYDIYGRPTWTRDGDSFINYKEYDPGSGGVIKTITDVDTTRTSDFKDLPAGWVTPPGGGLHLETQFGVDPLGREIQRTDPNGNITYTVYDDPNHEKRVYPGWNPDTNMPTGPTQVTREDRDHSPSYVEVLTMSALPNVGDDGRPDGTEAIHDGQSLTRTFTSPGGQVIEEDAYFSLDGVDYSTDPYLGQAGVNYYVTMYGYGGQGVQNQVVAPTGTITQTDYDGLGRAIDVMVGTSDSNLVIVSQNQYDNGGVGDGNLTQATLFPGGGAAPRVTQNFYDWRDRRVASKQGVQANENDGTHRPILYLQHDNRNEIVSQERYDGDGVAITITNGVPDRPAANLLRAKRTTAYDDQGRVYRTDTYSVDPTNGTVSSTSLMTGVWYNHRGQVIKTVQPGETMTTPGTCCGSVGPTGTAIGCSSGGCQTAGVASVAMTSASALGLVTKNQYDGAGRLIASFLTDGLGDTSWADAITAANNNVLSQTETQYDGDGNTIFVIQRQRFHDETRHGALGDPSSMDQGKARASYTASYYDAANRLTDHVDVGTNGGTIYDRPGSPPAGSDTVLVTHMDYDAAGRIAAVTDPRGLVTQTTYDLLNRTAQTVAAYTGDGTPTDNTNQTTAYTYDGDSHVLTQTAVLPGGATQTTQYVYGITAPVHSNDLLAAVVYPDNGVNHTEPYGYNALGQMVSKTDRDHTTHSYSYDVLGRQTADAVTMLGAGVDGQVRRLETAYNSQGLAYLFTSYDAASGGRVVNQVEQVFNGLGQIVTEYQAHAGLVDTGTTPKVQYAYSEMANGVNHSRLVNMTYPDGTVLRYNYAAGVDDAISRLTSQSDGTGVLEAYRYLGLNTVVIRSHPQPGVDLTYVKQAGEPDGDAGDPYTGVDRFGRVVDQRWLSTAAGSATDRFQYGYDADGNRLYRDNLVNPAFGELYQASGTDNGYDPLNRLTDFARGTLNDAHDAIVGTPSTSESWSLDALGNWASVTTDGTTQSRDHNAQNQITDINGNPLAYDNNGNLTADDVGQGYTYDAWNRVVAVYDSSGTGLSSYAYDALGRRVIEKSGMAVDLYFSRDWQVLEERVGAAVQARYVWSPVYVDALVLRDRDSERLYVQQDANWDVTAIVDVTGLVQERFVYDPYGRVSFLALDWVVRVDSLFGWVYLNRGGRYDDGLGLYDFRFRDYSPTLGQWLQQDPASYVDGMDLYLVTGDDPVRWVDPLGLWKWYGNWGGPGWTNGTDRWTEDDDFPRQGDPGFKKWIDPRDECYYGHDVCLHDCGKICDPKERQRCRRNCDIQLADCLRQLGGKYGWTGGEEWVFGRKDSPNNNPGQYTGPQPSPGDPYEKGSDPNPRNYSPQYPLPGTY